ncbi:protein kinase [Myxococcus stipitatus]|uniref:serine/threonine-protein kinase n=1 Tax=Myxococcus stipitatus TaxID=83455 RepID=UPI001F484043|nr:serine/threonine-protein kinase [Myxococcus stipitatus]MCE9667192.1 protein kinase [Myxococcus stipitatus]
MTLQAGTQIGKYVVRRKLAEGGMAEIYLCTARGPEGFEKEVVIKRVRAFLASDPEFVGMFIAEARLASRLNHANVVQIFDFDKHEDTYYLAMEYVRGCSLWDLRRRSKELMDPVPPMLVAHIGAEVARGLHYAHRLKVNGQPLDLVHRDVTPHNVLLSYDGAVKLTDFGIAKAGKKLTQPGVLKGKFAYMSPEQARGEAVDSRTDTFALGVVLWEMLTGGRLFDGDSELAVLRAVQHSVIAPPARLNPDVPPELDAAVMRALEREPDARFQTAGELERALAQSVLKHARTVDDTDLAAFMRRLFPASITQALPAVQERTHVVEGGPVPGADAVKGGARREPTAVMAAGRPGVARELSPDEDVDAATFVLPRREEVLVESAVPLPPMATPMLPLPAVASSPVPRPPPPVAAVWPSHPEGSAAASPSVPSAPTRTPSRSRGEGVPATAPDAAHEARRPSPPEGVPVVASSSDSRDVDEGDASTPEREEGIGTPGARAEGLPRRHSRPEVSRVVEAGAEAVVAAPSRGGAEVSSDSPGTEPLYRLPASGEVPTVTESSPSGAVVGRSSSRRAWVGWVVGLGLVVVGVVAASHFRAPLASGPEVAATGGAVDAPRPGPGEVAGSQVVRPSGESVGSSAPLVSARADAAVATPVAGPEEVEAEVEGQKREAELAPEPRNGVDGASGPRAEASAVVSTGTLVVRATPYATVFVDGRRLGEVSGRAAYKLTPGEHKLLFQHPSGEKRFDVTITAGGTVTREFRLSRPR